MNPYKAGIETQMNKVIAGMLVIGFFLNGCASSQVHDEAYYRRVTQAEASATWAKDHPDGQVPVPSLSRVYSAPVSVYDTAPVVDSDPDPVVWVNDYSGIYHYPGTRWYGITARGEYMRESDALARGYRAAYNGQ